MSAPTLIERIAGAIAVRRILSAELRAMGEPEAGLFESLTSVRARVRDAIVGEYDRARKSKETT